MLQGHTVSEVMSRECLTVRPELTIEKLVHEHILTSGRRCFPVVTDSRVLGLVTMHNIKAVPRDLWATKRVKEAMTPFENLKWVRPSDNLSSVLQLLAEEDVNQLPVVEGSNIVGMIARDSLLSFINVRSELGM